MTDPAPSGAAAAGTFTIGGELSVNRLGYGAMRITGKGVWGDPPDPAASIELLRRLPGLGVNFVDTADSYGPNVSEDLIREALAPYDGPDGRTIIATKAGLTRHGPDVWLPLGRPEYLRQCALMSLRRLGVERIDLFQLHRIDPAVPAEEQFGTLAELQREGLVAHLGLSQVGVADIEAASKHFQVATVQNLYNLSDRRSEDVLAHCEQNGIGFIPWFPLAAGSLAEPGGVVDDIAAKHGAGPGQVALAWLLRRSPVMLPIPGTNSVDHLIENVAAASLQLSETEFDLLSSASAE